jgi:hypothetical protein
MTTRATRTVAAARRERIAAFKAALATDAAWAHRAIVVLFQQQTASEQASDVTSVENGVGFTGFDAEILSSFAKQIERGRTLSSKQLAIAHRKLPKYAAQLVRLAEAKEAAPAPAPRDCPQCEREDCAPGRDLCAICWSRNQREEDADWHDSLSDEEWEECVRGALSDEQMYPRDAEHSDLIQFDE